MNGIYRKKRIKQKKGRIWLCIHSSYLFVIYQFGRLFINAFIRNKFKCYCIYLFVYLFMFIYWLINLFIHSYIYVFIYLLIDWFIYSFMHYFNDLCIIEEKCPHSNAGEPSSFPEKNKKGSDFPCNSVFARNSWNENANEWLSVWKIGGRGTACPAPSLPLTYNYKVRWPWKSWIRTVSWHAKFELVHIFAFNFTLICKYLILLSLLFSFV